MSGGRGGVGCTNSDCSDAPHATQCVINRCGLTSGVVMALLETGARGWGQEHSSVVIAASALYCCIDAPLLISASEASRCWAQPG